MLIQGYKDASSFSAAPDFIMHPYQSLMGSLEGGERAGVPPIKYGVGESVWKFFGFTPTREAETYKAVSLAKEKRESRLAKLDGFTERYLQVRKNFNQEDWQKLQADIREEFLEEKKKGKEGIPITLKDVRDSARRRRKYRERGYTEQMPKYMRFYQRALNKSFSLD